nr:MAG TPA: hypothetical protein [Caudoviricetes sp.]
MIAGASDHSDRAANKSLYLLQSRTTENQEERSPAHECERANHPTLPSVTLSIFNQQSKTQPTLHLSSALSTS